MCVYIYIYTQLYVSSVRLQHSLASGTSNVVVVACVSRQMLPAVVALGRGSRWVVPRQDFPGSVDRVADDAPKHANPSRDYMWPCTRSPFAGFRSLLVAEPHSAQ